MENKNIQYNNQEKLKTQIIKLHAEHNRRYRPKLELSTINIRVLNYFCCKKIQPSATHIEDNFEIVSDWIFMNSAFHIMTYEKLKKIEDMDCEKKMKFWQTVQFNEENKKAAEQNKKAGLPELQGTKKQIAWAESIRIKKIKEFELELLEYIEEDEKDEIVKAKEILKLCKENTSASFWIDIRGKSIF